MRIISKFKDYYDHLTGLYGIDNNIVYNRDGNPKIEYWSWNDGFDEINICGKLYFSIYLHKEKKLIFDINEIIDIILNDKFIRQSVSHKSTVSFPNNEYQRKNMFLPYQGMPAKKKLNQPIASLQFGENFNLSNTIIPKMIPAQEIYLELINFLTPKDIEIKTKPTDMNLFESKGFDKKTSFRKM